jgi:DNA topoisomerase-1
LDIKSSPGKIVYNTTGIFTNLNLTFELNKQFTTTDEIRDFLEKCKCWGFLCSTTSPKKVIKKAPEPLTTSSLQQLASNELHMSPKDTMKHAQQLYEAGYITYMRTDSKKYSNEFIDSVKTYILNAHGEKYISQNIDSLIVGNKTEDEPSKKTIAQQKSIPAPQEAHEAIRPVNVNIKAVNIQETTTDLLAKSIKLYELIWKRTLESCMPSAQYNSVSAKITAPEDREFVYKTEQPIFLGWQIIDGIEQVANDKNYQYITTLKQNVSMSPKKIDAKFTMNELKSHYTEARLVQLLEEKGIGRPSTFASLIDKIQERKYVEKQNITGKEIECIDFSLNNNLITEITAKREFGNEKNKLVIQPLGIIVIEFLLSKFDAFFNYEYTKLMEDSLDRIANGKTKWNSLCDDCFNELTNITKDLQDLKKFSIEIDNEHTLIIGKHGPVVKCINSKDPKKITFLAVKKNLDLEDIKQKPHLTLEDVIDNTTTTTNKDAIGKYKGQDLFIKKGKYGVYAQWGKETKSLKEDLASTPIEEIEYIDVIRYLDKDTILDPTKPVGLVRELNKHISIRTGKYGDYIFYKKPRATKPEFLKLNGFDSDYKKCDKILILNWIKQKYNVE